MHKCQWCSNRHLWRHANMSHRRSYTKWHTLLGSEYICHRRFAIKQGRCEIGTMTILDNQTWARNNLQTCCEMQLNYNPSRTTAQGVGATPQQPHGHRKDKVTGMRLSILAKYEWEHWRSHKKLLNSTCKEFQKIQCKSKIICHEIPGKLWEVIIFTLNNSHFICIVIKQQIYHSEAIRGTITRTIHMIWMDVSHSVWFHVGKLIFSKTEQ